MDTTTGSSAVGHTTRHGIRGLDPPEASVPAGHGLFVHFNARHKGGNPQRAEDGTWGKQKGLVVTESAGEAARMPRSWCCSYAHVPRLALLGTLGGCTHACKACLPARASSPTIWETQYSRSSICMHQQQSTGSCPWPLPTLEQQSRIETPAVLVHCACMRCAGRYWYSDKSWCGCTMLTRRSIAYRVGVSQHAERE